MLDGRAALQRGAKCFLTFNDDADVAAFVGQHAKAGTPNAHLAHTQTQAAVDFRINGISLGEFGQLSYGFFEKQIPVIFASGDLALTREAEDLIPGIFTSAVKEGFNKALDSACPTEQVMPRQSSALHYPRTKVLADIRKQASCAMAQYLSKPESFRIKPLEGPYVAEAEYRATAPKDIPVLGDLPPRRITTGVHETVAGAFEEFYSTLEWAVPVEGKHFKLL